MNYQQLQAQAHLRHLDIFGAFRATTEDNVPDGTVVLVLLGPREPGYWAHIQSEPEYTDGEVDLVDTWSGRVIGQWADQIGATPVFPFGGPPYQPFISWALRSGRIWTSPVNLLVHDVAGLFVSFRGALCLPFDIDLPTRSENPCSTCADKPCLHSCPASALTPEDYDLAACHAFLDTSAGAENCMSNGCAVRRSCPVSQKYGRLPEQSAHHMSFFHRPEGGKTG